MLKLEIKKRKTMRLKQNISVTCNYGIQLLHHFSKIDNSTLSYL